MDKPAVLKLIRDIGVIPVVRAGSPDEARQLGEAIVAGGLPILEIALTVPGAVELIGALAQSLGGRALIGAGSVLDAASARACIAAGARFIVSPVLAPEVIACCRNFHVTVLAGALTPTEVLCAWNSGADFVKVFPVGAMGGARYIKSLKAPLPHIEMVPTGGVTRATAAAFIEAGAVAVGAGADLADVGAIREGRPGDVSAAARAYVKAVREARPKLAA